ncbi:MAG: alpha/beta hydrolase, partial [Bacteroidales bacterium]|nr:alpha/beta hydrolase [Bacteroidales bacterium]
MKRNLLLIVNLLCGMLLAFPQSGTWSGNLKVQGMKLPLVFHLDGDKPTMDSPAQGAEGIPVNVTRIEPDSIHISIPSIMGSFGGRCDKDEITGIFTQRGARFPLVLQQVANKQARPQTPRPPFPYSQEEVSFSNGDATLKGTLTLPEGYGRATPVVIMITGSGLQNRDEEIFGHKPFAVIADRLARNGVASLRYDDRGFGESTGDAVNSTTEDFMRDALAGIGLLRERFDKVGVLGHSEGATIALMLGADRKVDFIVSLAAMAISGRETLMDQNRHALSQSGFPQEVVEEYCSLLSSAFDGDSTLAQRLESSGLPKELRQNLQLVAQQVSQPYLRYFLAMNVADVVGRIKCPVLALNGTKDTQVDSSKNLEVLKKGLPAGKKNEIRSLEDLNHLFQHCTTGNPDEYALIEETISPEVLEIITRWISTL